MTKAAQRFVGSSTFSALTGLAVDSDMFAATGERHVELAEWSDVIVVAPATADTLARIAAGRADDLLGGLLLCATCPVVFAPAMHPNMFAHPMVQDNVARLNRVSGWKFAGPVEGEVASGDHGLGRLMAPESIAWAVLDAVAGVSHSLAGRRIVVTAGPTSESIDPVRALTNRSSGKMGFAVAARAAARGATVTLIAGPVHLATPRGVDRVNVVSALQMQGALENHLGAQLELADALIMCAAVADYRPRAPSKEKTKREAKEIELQLVANPDLLATVGRQRTSEPIFLLGFAVETANRDVLIERAREKLEIKRVDAIVANRAEDAFEGDSTKAVIVTQDTEQDVLGSKLSVADDILDFLENQFSVPKT